MTSTTDHNAPPTIDLVNALESAAHSEIDAARRAVAQLATIAADHLEDPGDGDRDKAWDLVRYLKAGTADHFAAKLYLLMDPEQREASALLEADARHRRLTDPDGDPYEVSIPAPVSSWGYADEIRVGWAEGDGWHVLRLPESGTARALTGRSPKVAEHDILRVALEAAAMYGGGASAAWAKRVERDVLATILEALR